jgi:RHS repeat-associated protein
MQAVAQGQQADSAEVPAGASSVSVQGSAGTSVSLAAPSLGTTTTRGGGIIVPQCTKHALNTYYATDHLGTVRFTKTIDETGAVTTTTHDYEPFGVEITPTDECDNTHKFTGHERDTETGNDYMHFRFFSASMGRFQKPDSNFDNPTSNPQGWNLYSYVKGNPVNFNDPTGHMPALHRGTWHPQFPQWLMSGMSPQEMLESSGDSFGNVIVNGLWTGEYVHLDDGDGNPSSGFYTTSNATVGTNWGAWYRFYGVGNSVVGAGESDSGSSEATSSDVSQAAVIRDFAYAIWQQTRKDDAEAMGFLVWDARTGKLETLVVRNPLVDEKMNPQAEKERKQIGERWRSHAFWDHWLVTSQLIAKWGSIGQRYQMMAVGHGHRESDSFSRSPDDMKYANDVFRMFANPMFQIIAHQNGVIYYGDGWSVSVSW